MEKNIISKKADFLLIKFPIWIPILYLVLSKLNESMFLPTLILFLFLGELHLEVLMVSFLIKITGSI